MGFRFIHALAAALSLSLLSISSVAPATAEKEASAAASDGYCWNAGEAVDVQKFSLPELERCIVAGSDPNVLVSFDFTLLSTMVWAVSEPWDDYVDFVRLLLEAGADPDALNYTGRTPLAEATRRGHADVIQVLRNAGAK